jgi:hypothetical protein
MLRYSIFVVIDGVFRQHEALPLREIIDVLDDDAQVIGASSMGALRAAECWPAGMQGVGSIYRLFRRGALGSDEEVAVSFDPDNPQWSSVPLINIRHALSRAVREHRLDQGLAERLLTIAKRTYYADRHWRSLLREAGADAEDPHLEQTLAGYDLKRSDAITALRRVSRRLSEMPESTYRPRRTTRPFSPTEHYRERPHTALDGLSEKDVKPALMQFLLSSGRQHRFLGEPVDPAQTGGEIHALADRIWDALTESGELDAEIFRWRAIHTAPVLARQSTLQPTPSDREVAEREIAEAHGASCWSDLETRIDPSSELWNWILAYRESLTWARCPRNDLFGSAR